MKQFHISDILSVTTGRLVSADHMGGIYNILNFLTGDNLFMHQLPRAMQECEPWLRSQFPDLFPENAIIARLISEMDEQIPSDGGRAVSAFVEAVRAAFDLPEMIPVYEMSAEMHTHIDPVEEALAMVGDEKVIVLETN